MNKSLSSVNEKVVKAKKYAENTFSIESMADTYFDYLMI